MAPMTWDEVYDYCDSNREADGFCRCCTSCSGPEYSNLSCDYQDRVKGIRPLRGGNNRCYFEVKE